MTVMLQDDQRECHGSGEQDAAGPAADNAGEEGTLCLQEKGSAEGMLQRAHVADANAVTAAVAISPGRAARQVDDAMASTRTAELASLAEQADLRWVCLHARVGSTTKKCSCSLLEQAMCMCWDGTLLQLEAVFHPLTGMRYCVQGAG